MTTSPRKMMGLDVPADQKVAIPARTWSAVKLAMWRSRTGWEIALRAAVDMVQRCAHTEGCPGEANETEPCLPSCPDREQRMSALVVLNAARMFAPVEARKPAGEAYSAPSREFFSEIVGELLALQAELEALHTIGVTVSPPQNTEAFLTQRAPPQFSAADFTSEDEEAP
jgi:hypothetical protein